MKNRTLALLSIASGLLLTLSWPYWGFPIIALFAFVPLLFVFDNIYKYKQSHIPLSGFTYSLLALFVWNALTTWWIWNSTSFGAIAVIILNSIFLSIPLGLHSFLRRKFFTKSKGYFALICLWLTFEYLHFDWDLAWPWLMLGNAFAKYPILIQWYEITGVLGGSLWILLTNIFVYELILSIKEKNINKRAWITLTSIIIIVPIGYSMIRYFTYSESVNPIEVVVIQQNTDPWGQYDVESEDLIHNILELAREKTTSKTQLIVAPESAIQDYAWQNKLDQYSSIDSLFRYIDENPQINILMGISTLRMYENPEEKSITARKYGGNSNMYYDSYNTALFINSFKETDMYHKSKLVPGVEKMPFPEYLGNLSEFALDLGGITGSLGTDKERKVFKLENSQAVVGSIICFESNFGDFYGEFVRNGANLMTIITNDGWWKKTPGYRQHFEYARLRAIETRRSIARAANTGTSGFINQRGDVLQKTEWWTPTVIKETLNLNSKKTFYTKYGDYIGKISLYVSIIILLLYFLQLFFPAIRKIR
jgi:apolipoprotein N-acyltransferase